MKWVIKSMDRGRRRNLYLRFLGIVGLSLFFVFGHISQAYAKTAESTFPPASMVQSAAKRALPSVVHLDIQKESPSDLHLSRYFPLLTPPKAKVGDLIKARFGTGIIINPQGYILTNAFLIEGARKVRCLLLDGRWFDTKCVGMDPKTDIGILKITKRGSYPAIAEGDPKHLSTGQWIVALGHFEPNKPTIATGIISAEHRSSVLEPETPQDFLQTDTQINLVNTGGPLIDLKGTVVGVNDALLSRIAPLSGIGFAIPWTIASHVAQQLIESGSIEHGWLGLQVQDVIFRSKKGRLGFIKSVMVLHVIKDSPASRAGIRVGDIIKSYGKTPIQNVTQLKRLVSRSPVGSKVKMKISRHGREMTLSVTVGKREETLPSSDLKERLGIFVIPLGRNSPKKQGGVIITWVDPNGPMGRAGFEPHDIILEINGKPIKTGKDIEQVLNSLNLGGYLLFHAVDHRTGRMGYVQIRTR